jgi:hypothetical protein
VTNRIAESDINVMALVKGTERYVFLWEDGQEAALMNRLGQFAANPSLSFTWYDAATCRQRVMRVSD